MGCDDALLLSDSFLAGDCDGLRLGGDLEVFELFVRIGDVGDRARDDDALFLGDSFLAGDCDELRLGGDLEVFELFVRLGDDEDRARDDAYSLRTSSFMFPYADEGTSADAASEDGALESTSFAFVP